MGIFKDLNALKKQAKEIDKTFDPGAQMREGKQRMAAAQEMLAQQTRKLPRMGREHRCRLPLGEQLELSSVGVESVGVE